MLELATLQISTPLRINAHLATQTILKSAPSANSSIYCMHAGVSYFQFNLMLFLIISCICAFVRPMSQIDFCEADISGPFVE